MDQYLLLSVKDDYAEVLYSGDKDQMEEDFEACAIDWDSQDSLLMVKVVKSAEPILDIKEWGDDEVRPTTQEGQAAVAGR
jgi:hypothetical protein